MLRKNTANIYLFNYLFIYHGAGLLTLFIFQINYLRFFPRCQVVVQLMSSKICSKCVVQDLPGINLC